jgi:hypothetical protein
MAQTELNMYDAYDALSRRELAIERSYDLTVETAAECDGISPANIPVFSSLRISYMDGATNLSATINSLCDHVRTLSENAADTIRDAAADRDAIADVAAQYATENEGLRQRVVNVETLLRSIREEWDRESMGWVRLQLDLVLDNPELRRAA